MNLFSNSIPFSDLFCCGRLVDYKARAVEKELKAASARIKSQSEIVVPDDCELLEAFVRVQNDTHLKIKAGEYEWDGDVIIESTGVRIEGEEGTCLFGSIILKTGSSGLFSNLEVSF